MNYMIYDCDHRPIGVIFVSGIEGTDILSLLHDSSYIVKPIKELRWEEEND